MFLFFKEQSIFQNSETLVDWVSNSYSETNHVGVVHYQAVQMSLVHISL